MILMLSQNLNMRSEVGKELSCQSTDREPDAGNFPFVELFLFKVSTYNVPSRILT